VGLVVDASLTGGLGRSLVDGGDDVPDERGGSASSVQATRTLPPATSAVAVDVAFAKNSRRV
jgi:hypothetical protein